MEYLRTTYCSGKRLFEPSGAGGCSFYYFSIKQYIQCTDAHGKR